MTDVIAEHSDPLSAPFWRAASGCELFLQRCRNCDQNSLYPRPFCVVCHADTLEWVKASGLGVVFSKTKVWRQVLPELPPPYSVAIVELDEGPRLMTRVINGEASIGDRVRVAWLERGGEPRLPVFEPYSGSFA
ncbi:OB-fold domain-containing protein [Mesorhizobium sp.]|uniref:Zn-ribbon domain-containing OB-fold protein n=1 Tax=Mesorhizobium sp. TaxID=1871066 RepID=UPI000FE36152|nr:MAG: nucleic acid-binding protein [Mesorhizobium sp.]RWO75378.1 MAG: nucleic acid-binding protein [Mesorhizobium sp.]TJU74343.1 MAG: nucleic acid-binding protein [Mesorhizobium sp.]